MCGTFAAQVDEGTRHTWRRCARPKRRRGIEGPACMGRDSCAALGVVELTGNVDATRRGCGGYGCLRVSETNASGIQTIGLAAETVFEGGLRFVVQHRLQWSNTDNGPTPTSTLPTTVTSDQSAGLLCCPRHHDHGLVGRREKRKVEPEAIVVVARWGALAAAGCTGAVGVAASLSEWGGRHRR